MKNDAKEFIISFRPKSKKKALSFFDMAKKHIVKKRSDVGSDLSKKIDKIVYGI